MEKDHRTQYRMRKAHDYISQRKHLHALQIYEKILNEDPLNQDALFKTAEIFEYLGSPDKGAELLLSAIEEQPDNQEMKMFAGQYLLRNQKWETAIEILSHLPSNDEPLVTFFIGYSHYMLKEFELAKINLLNFLDSSEKDETYYEANLYLAKIEMKLGEFKSALAFAKKADIVYNNFWELNSVYAEIYFNLGMHAHAIAPIEKAKKLNAHEPLLFELAGKIYFSHGDYAKAEKNFRKLVDISEEVKAGAYVLLAEACVKTKKVKDAALFYELALKIEPENKKASEGLKNLPARVKESAAGDA